MSRFVVIGGAGAMGQITVRDLVEFGDAKDEIIVADYNLAHAQEFVRSLHDRRLSAVQVDARDRAGTARILNGSLVAINCVQYQLNLELMEAALLAKTNYMDLGGLFHYTRRQLELDERFRAIGKLALIGMGAAPGITNILARHAADKLDKLTELHARLGSSDRTKYTSVPALPVSYSLQTILEEFSFEPAVFSRGRFKFVKPMSGDKPHRFPNPVGVRRPMYTIHSEVATLPLSFKSKGIKEVSFKIAFDPQFVDRVRFLRDFGLAGAEPLQVGEGFVKPIEVVNKIARLQAPAQSHGKLRQYEVVRMVAKGFKKGKKVTMVLDCHTKGMPEWGVGTDINTGSPPAIAAIMLARQELAGTGVLPPETVIPPKAFFAELKKRKMWIKESTKNGWTFAT